MLIKWNAPNESTENLFWYFVAERQRVWHNRNVLKLRPPWTDDEVISNARFTNVYRELDRGTQFCMEQIVESPHIGSFGEIVFHTLAYRWFNRIETYVNLIKPFCYPGREPEWERMLTAMLMARENKDKLYTGAYIATYCPDMGSGDKVTDSVLVLQLLWETAARLVEMRKKRSATMINVVNTLREVRGVGPFIAYQCTLDWTYPVRWNAGWAVMPDVDVNSWAQPGPGAIKGLALMGVSGGLPSQLRAMMCLKEKAPESLEPFGWLPPTTAAGERVELSLANIEHSLCEFQKYHRMIGGGTVKTIWRPSTEGAWRPTCTTIPAWEDPTWKTGQRLTR